MLDSERGAVRQTIADRIAAALAEDIAEGLIAPGERLDEVRLAERFRTSRTPVREALNRLVAQQILTTGARRGVFVAELDRSALAQMFEAMQEIEQLCARLAAKRLTLLARAEIETAQAACERAAEAGDRAAFLRANDLFHLAIYRATGNRFVAEFAAGFRFRTGPFRARKFRTRDDLLKSCVLHREIVRTIVNSPDAGTEGELRQRMTENYIEALAAL